jgi:hypothetical protein
VAWWEMAGGRQAAPATGACLCVAMVNLGGKKGMGRKKTVVDLRFGFEVPSLQQFLLLNAKGSPAMRTRLSLQVLLKAQRCD